jgi:hypothetical protein
MTIDGSDNSTYGFPYLKQRTHNSSKGIKVKSKLYAAILHGKFAATFTYASNLTGGSNVTIEIIHRMLELYLNDQPGNRLPPTLWVQLDNTCRDNKNRFVFAYAHSLVDMGLFQAVEINFLPVGHTHCDIDQLFSRISVHLYGNDCFDFQDLLNKSRKACKMVKYTQRLYGFADFKDHLLQHDLIETGKKFSGFGGYRQFRFRRVEYRDEHGRLQGWSTMFQARLTVFHPDWTDLEGNIEGHIPLCKKPLSFENLFGSPKKPMDLSTLNYIANAVPVPVNGKGKDQIAEMTNGVMACAGRLNELCGIARGTEILNGLLHEIKLQKEDRLIPFTWDLSFYRNPPTIWDPNSPCVHRSEEDLHSVRKEAKAIIDIEDNGGIINKDMKLTNIGDYVIVCANLEEDPLKRPFWVGQVSDNDPARRKMVVTWLLPPTRVVSSKDSKHKDDMDVPDCEKDESEATRRGVSFYQQQFDTPRNVPLQRRNKPQKPSAVCLLKNYPYAQFKVVLDCNSNAKSNSNKGNRKMRVPTSDLHRECVYFSFQHLAKGNRLPNSVLDAISEEPDINWMG